MMTDSNLIPPSLSYKLPVALIPALWSAVKADIYLLLMRRLYNSFWCLPLILAFLAGCLQHSYEFVIHPDGSANIVYEVSGDVADLEDGLELHPDSTIWEMNRTVEEREGKTVHRITASARAVSVDDWGRLFDWARLPADTIYPSRSFILDLNRNPLYTIYRFAGLFGSREYLARYGDTWDFIPPECHALEDDESRQALAPGREEELEKMFALGIIQWNRARYERAFDRLWSIAQSRGIALPDSGSDVHSITRTGWADDLRRYLNSLDIPNPESANLDWWEDLRPQFLGRFADFVDPARIPMIGDIADALEQEYKATRDLQDDKFEVKASLPGILIRTNGDRESPRKVVWEFKGETLQRSDGFMIAVAILPDYVNILGILVILMSGIGLITFRRRIRRSGGRR